jgi:glycosyltransferase involved in cell wall biosynthesis
MAPKITVILLTCNRPTFVRQALEGLRQQTYTNWTLTASDCSSIPAAREEISKLMEQHRQNDPAHETRIIQQPKIIPEGENLRLAMLDVSTPYVALLHDDDVWMANHLERACEWLDQSPKHGLSISNGRVIDANSVEQGWTNSREDPIPDPADQQGWFRLFMSSFFASSSGYVFRHEAIANHTFYPVAVVDIDLALSIVLNDYQVVGFHDPSYFYRVHEGSSYEKGPQVTRDRHTWRLWLFRRQGLRIVRKFPLFLLFVIKSAASKATDAFLDATQKRSVVCKE